MVFLIILLIIILILACICAIIAGARNEAPASVIAYGTCCFLALVSLLVCIDLKIKGNTEEVTYTFSSKNYQFKKEIVVSTTVQETEDGIFIVEDRDTLYIITGREQVFGFKDNNDKIVDRKTIDLRKEK